MSPPGRPKGEYRSAQHEGCLMSPPGRPKGEYRSAQHEASLMSPPGRPKDEYRSAQHEGSLMSRRRGASSKTRHGELRNPRRGRARVRDARNLPAQPGAGLEATTAIENAAPDRATARAVIDSALGAGRDMLDESEAKTVLKAHGMTSVSTRAAGPTAAAAVAAVGGGQGDEGSGQEGSGQEKGAHASSDPVALKRNRIQEAQGSGNVR